MTRHILLAAALAVACSTESSPTPSRPRVDVVKPGGGAAPAPGDFCDQYFAADKAPALVLPEAVAARPGDKVPALPRGRWVWLNLWATWCGPCQRELPLVRRWREMLAFDLWLLSVDEDAAALDAFLPAHPEIQGDASLRVVTVDAVPRWLATFGLPEDARIPVHILVDPSGRVRCARAGELKDQHFPTIKRLITSSGT